MPSSRPFQKKAPGGDHILLVGMMGAGKSTVGAALAKKLDRPYIDNDDQVEHVTGRTYRGDLAGSGRGRVSSSRGGGRPGRDPLRDACSHCGGRWGGARRHQSAFRFVGGPGRLVAGGGTDPGGSAG